MPIKIANGLPARKTLESENIFVMDENRATTQDIRPLKILILNLMPTKITTETQLARLLGNTPLQIEVELLAVSGWVPKHTSKEHMLTFYKVFDDIKDQYFDGMVITGAPVELMDFEEVDYWRELCRIMDWSTSHVYSTFHICWGAQAALYHHYGIPKVVLPEKMFGVFSHRVTHRGSILFRGFDDTFMVPHSRHTTVRKEDILKTKGLKILAESEEAEFTLFLLTRDAGYSSWVTRNMIQRRWRQNISEIKKRGLTSACPRIIFPKTMTAAGRPATGAPAPICFTRTGSIILYISPHLMISIPCRL